MDISGYAFVVGGGKSYPRLQAYKSKLMLWYAETTGSGIGKACAMLFAKEGAAGLMVADQDVNAAGNVAAECKAVATKTEIQVDQVHIDVTQESSVQNATAQAMQTFGRIDYCVNSAGVSYSLNGTSADH